MPSIYNRRRVRWFTALFKNSRQNFSCYHFFLECTFSSVIFFLFDHMAKVGKIKPSTSRRKLVQWNPENFFTDANSWQLASAGHEPKSAECFHASPDENKSLPTRSGGSEKGATISMALEFFSPDIAGYERKEFAWRHRKANCRGRWNHEWMGIEVDCSFALWFIHWIVFGFGDVENI